MDARFYNSDTIDIERLASDLSNLYMAQGYQAQHFGGKDHVLVQLKKGGDLEALIGLQAALSLTLQHVSGGTLAMIGQQKWLDKAAVGAIGLVAAPILWPLAFTAGAGAIRQANLGSRILSDVDNMVRLQQPNVQPGPVPPQFAAQFQQQPQQPYYTPPFSAPPQQPYYTPSQPTQPPQQPYYTPQPAPQPQQPYYTPPETQEPPVQPQPRVTINQPPYTPPAPPKPPVPQVPPYVPPVTQNPSVQPQPKVTFTPSQQAPASPPPLAQPRPQPQYYVPSQSAQQPAQQAQNTQSAQSTQSAQPVQSHPSSEPAVDPNAVWGVLTFNDGTPVQLKGDRALIGRYDHDLGGDRPAVDLSEYQGADTTSRMHAVIEHIGSSYTLTDLDSTNSTRINGKRIEPERPTPVNDGDTLAFGTVTCTFKRM